MQRPITITMIPTLVASVAAALLPAVIGSSAPCLSLTIDATSPLNVVAPYFASWNIDPSRDRLFFDTNFSDPQLLYLAGNIGGARIRFGGTGADYLWYQVGNAAPCGPRTDTYECLNSTWWGNLQAISAAARSPLIFGVNIHPHNKSSPPKGPWDTSNARDLLAYAKANGQPMFALELGNEQNTIMTAVQQAAAFVVLSDLLTDVYGTGSDRPLLIGPDTHSFRDAGSSDAKVLQYLHDFTAAAGAVVSAITHHEYIEIDARNVVNATFLDTSAGIAARVVAAVRAANTSMPVFAGEIGPHNGGTTPNPDCAGNKVCGRFGSALWYADSMSAKASAGYSAYCRQDVIGADYALLNSSTHAPSADYYLLVLWKKLVGTHVLNVTMTQPADRSVRAYAYCGSAGPPSVTLLLLNIGASAVCVAPPSVASPDTTMTQYTLTAGPGGVESATALLNGVVLALDAAGRLPALTGASVTGDLQLPPLSISLVVVPTAALGACTAAPTRA